MAELNSRRKNKNNTYFGIEIGMEKDE